MRGRGLEGVGRGGGMGIRGIRGRSVRRGGRVRGMGGRGMTEGYFPNFSNQGLWNESEASDMYGVENRMNNVADENMVDEDCVVVENDEMEEVREVEMSGRILTVKVSGEKDRGEVINKGGTGVEEGEENGVKVASSKQVEPSLVTGSTVAQIHREAEIESGSDEFQVGANRPIIQASEIGEEERGGMEEERGVGGSSNSSAACTASESKTGEEEPSVTGDREKGGEEQTGGGQSHSGLAGEGKGDNGGKTKQREIVMKAARLSMSGRSDAGLRAAAKLAQFKAGERNGGGEKGGGDKGGKSSKKDGSGAGSVTTRSQAGKK